MNNARYITNIAVATQTFDNLNTPGYMDGVNSQPAPPGYEDFGGFLKLSIWLNDGPVDSSSSDPFVQGSPDGQPGPGTLLATSIIPTPTYPQGGTSRSSNGLNDPNNAGDNGLDPWIVNFPFPNVLVPDVFTFSLINTNKFGMPDGYNFDGNQFGLWHGTFTAPSLNQPATGGPFYYGTNYNTNVVGTSRTGPNVNRFTNTGHWTWVEYNGPRVSPTPWENDRNNNAGPEATIYATTVPIPEPSSVALAGLALIALFGMARQRRDN